MNIPKLTTAALAAALTAVAAPTLSTSAQAAPWGWHGGSWHGGWHGGGWGWGGVGLGLAAGAIIGSALAAPYYDYGYYDYPVSYGYGVGPAFAYYGGPYWGHRHHYRHYRMYSYYRRPLWRFRHHYRHHGYR